MTVITYDHEYGVWEPGAQRVKVHYKSFPNEEFHRPEDEGYEDLNFEEACLL